MIIVERRNYNAQARCKEIINERKLKKEIMLWLSICAIILLFVIVTHFCHRKDIIFKGTSKSNTAIPSNLNTVYSVNSFAMADCGCLSVRELQMLRADTVVLQPEVANFNLEKGENKIYETQKVLSPDSSLEITLAPRPRIWQCKHEKFYRLLNRNLVNNLSIKFWSSNKDNNVWHDSVLLLPGYQVYLASRQTQNGDSRVLSTDVSICTNLGKIKRPPGLKVAAPSSRIINK